MDLEMGYLMYIGNQKFKRVQVFINRDSRGVPVLAGKVSGLGNSFFTKLKVKWILFPELYAIVQR